ncbi:hypothetical protein H2200_004796 [Cladophialophora chaetospira]|uniref:Uncharacterized protein n=1 Tax=Cladophialophora chaetospira TaxID=386627 RepID=A0AA39CJT2_9EURO|nr:hypothetical protein H2200_004796 [Cladophialophora chaetospira]
MGVQDFVHFDLDEYSAKVRGFEDEQLQKKEVILIRTLYSSTAGVISGVIMALGTGGASLVGSVAGGRMMHLVEQKLEIIRAELTRRGLPLHQKTTRDQAIPAATGGIAGAMGLASGMEGHMIGAAAGAAANLVGVEVEDRRLDRVHTAPERPTYQPANSFQKLKRSLTQTASSKTRSIQYPFSSEDKNLFGQYDNLLERKKSLEERYQKLRESTLGAAGDKWYWYVIYHYPCKGENLTISTQSGLWIDSLRRRDSLGQWNKSIQQAHRRRARAGLDHFRGELDQISKRFDEWQVLIKTCLPPGPISAPSASAEMLLALNRTLTICLAPVVCYWILWFPWFRLAYRLLFLILLGFGVHARLLWDYEMYPFPPRVFSKT